MSNSKPPSNSAASSSDSSNTSGFEHLVTRSLMDDDEKLSMPPNFQQFLAFPQPSALDQDQPVYRSLLIHPSNLSGSDSQLGHGGSNLSGTKMDPDLMPPSLSSFKSAPLLNVNPWSSSSSSSSGVKARVSDFAEQLVHVSAAPVPDLPSYFEKYTSFQSLQFPKKIFEQITEALKLMPVDFELLGSRQQIHGSFYEEHNSAKFQINLFKNGRKYLVEVQRRSGDSMAFNTLYQRLKKELLEMPNCIIDQSQGQAVQAPAPPRPQAYDVILDQSSLQPLKTMAESQYVDVAREGMKMLARCSSSDQNHVLLSNQCLDLFRSRLSSPDEELARYAAFILANLSRSSAFSESLSSAPPLLDTLFSALQRTDSKEIRRQVAQSVHNVSLSRPNCFSKDQLEILRPLRASPDTRLSQIIDNTLARFQVGQV